MPNSNNTQEPLALLTDPSRLTVSASQACAILGIAKSTGHHAYKATGQLADGIPVMKVGRRYVVSVIHLRTALGLPTPE
jgi:hypothetical protein